MAAATWVREELEQEGVPFAELHHAEVYTAQGVAQCEHISGHRMAKAAVAMNESHRGNKIIRAMSVHAAAADRAINDSDSAMPARKAQRARPLRSHDSP